MVDRGGGGGEWGRRGWGSGEGVGIRVGVGCRTGCRGARRRWGRNGVQRRLGGVRDRDGVQGHRWGARRDTGACSVLLGEGCKGPRKGYRGNSGGAGWVDSGHGVGEKEAGGYKGNWGLNLRWPGQGGLRGPWGSVPPLLKPLVASYIHCFPPPPSSQLRFPLASSPASLALGSLAISLTLCPQLCLLRSRLLSSPVSVSNP